jgi:hypothetical protein
MQDQLAAAIQGIFWPKAFFDFLTTSLDAAVKPIPYLQVGNILCSLLILAWEWPVAYIAGTTIHSSLKSRIPVLVLAAVPSILLYQSTNAAIYYLTAAVVYLWAYVEGEVCGFSSYFLLGRTAHFVNMTGCSCPSTDCPFGTHNIPLMTRCFWHRYFWLEFS